MAEIEGSPVGGFCWAELATTDQGAAKAFYQSLFGWRADETPMGAGETYTTFRKSSHAVAASYRLRPEQEGVPPHWQVYVRVASADATAAKARDLGGSVVAEPFDVFDLGRMAVLQDPQGAVIAAWQPGKHSGFGIVDEAGAFCWAELMAREKGGPASFYAALFGWGTRGDPRYTEWTLGGRSIGGMIEIEKEWGDVPPHWLVYFQVDDCDAIVAKATSLGATAVMGPQDLPAVGRFALLKDPQGASFYVIKLTAGGH